MRRSLRVSPPRRGLRASLAVPGDKSLAHRAVLLGALAEGATTVSGFPPGVDVLATVGAVRALGAAVEQAGDRVHISGRGPGLAREGTVTIDCGNSGTTMRLTAGLLAGGGAVGVLDGDASLRARPMERVAEPLRAMGAEVTTSGGCPPVRVHGGNLRAVAWTSPVASAQVKSAVLLAGLRARGTTQVREPHPSRDHTERMLPSFGVQVARSPAAVSVEGGQRLRGTTIALPGDVSSAAFLVVAALLVPDSDLRLENVGVNPTRTGFLSVLTRMGAGIEVLDLREVAGEPRADLRVRSARLRGTSVQAEEMPATIDEIPILCVAAALADGDTVFGGAGELRVKESDRIAAMEQLRHLGVGVETRPDGLVVHGTAGRRLKGAPIDAVGDHRIAMAFAVAGLVADDGVELRGPSAAEVSFPGFFSLLTGLGVGVAGDA